VRLEALNPHRSFASAAERARSASSRDELVRAAQSLNQWFEEVQR
jgi:hypothetical protein